MKHDMETILLVARAIACHPAPDKTQMWEANAALSALADAGLLVRPVQPDAACTERVRQFMRREAGYDAS